MRFALIVLMLVADACGGESPAPVRPVAMPSVTEDAPGPAPETDMAPHEHTAPHGGTLIVFGEEMAHLELLLDTATGSLTVYALDGEAENAIRMKQPEIEIRIAGDSGMAGDTIHLKPVANVLTGESSGDASQFDGTLKSLSGRSRFEGNVSRVELQGILYRDVPFRYPEGNEEPE